MKNMTDEMIQQHGCFQYEAHLMEKAVETGNRKLYYIALINLNTWINAVTEE